jgi:tRNA (guanine37-N1)-methyltransferase
MWTAKIISAYPEMFPGVLGHSIIGNALREKKWSLQKINLHDFSYDNRNSIDDSPFGGGPGMIIRPEVVEKAVNHSLEGLEKKLPLIYMTPCGKPLDQKDLVKYSQNAGIIVLCGRFEGVDARVIDNFGFERVSIGDYVLTGGEVAAQVLVEGCVRLLPGVLGHSESIFEESFSQDLLEYPQYTRPKIWVDNKGKKNYVPDILLSGHHEKIKEWRKTKSVEITKKYRPDLLKRNIKTVK